MTLKKFHSFRKAVATHTKVVVEYTRAVYRVAIFEALNMKSPNFFECFRCTPLHGGLSVAGMGADEWVRARYNETPKEDSYFEINTWIV